MVGWNGALRLGSDGGRGFGGPKAQDNKDRNGNGKGQQEDGGEEEEEAQEVEAVERVVGLVRGIGKQESRSAGTADRERGG